MWFMKNERRLGLIVEPKGCDIVSRVGTHRLALGILFACLTEGSLVLSATPPQRRLFRWHKA